MFEDYIVTDFSCHSGIQKMKELGEQAEEEEPDGNRLKIDKHDSLN